MITLARFLLGLTIDAAGLAAFILIVVVLATVFAGGH